MITLLVADALGQFVKYGLTASREARINPGGILLIHPIQGIRMKLLLPLAAIVATASLQAADLRDNIGVGVGTMIFEGQSGLLSQICAATTNGCFGNQTFAITTGTLGAKPWTGIVANDGVRTFVRDNMDQLAREMAAGKGESLDTLAELAGVPAADRGMFARNLQAHFADIYTSPTITDGEILANLAKVVDKA